MKQLSTLAPLAVAAAILWAHPARADDGYDKCMDAAVTNLDFAQCGGAMLARRDAVLNRVWKRVYSGLDAPAKAALLAEQRLWIPFKEKSCRYWQAGDYGREGAAVRFYGCQGAIIDQRIAYLEQVGKMGPDEEN